MRSIILAAAAALSFCASDAQARPHTDGSITQFCGDRVCGFVQTPNVRNVHSRHARAARHPRQDRAKGVRTAYEAQIIPHPHGCPRVRFCGCGLADYLFGKPVKAGGLALAKNWLGFPAAEAAEGMVAANDSHVFGILKVIRPGVVLAIDFNSGNHLSRIRERPLAGFSVRNPHGHNRVASLR